MLKELVIQMLSSSVYLRTFLCPFADFFFLFLSFSHFRVVCASVSSHRIYINLPGSSLHIITSRHIFFRLRTCFRSVKFFSHSFQSLVHIPIGLLKCNDERTMPKRKWKKKKNNEEIISYGDRIK